METQARLGTDFVSVINDSKQQIANIRKEKNTPVTTTGRNLAYAGLGLFTLFFVGMIAMQIIAGVFAIFATVVFGTLSFLILKHAKKLDPLIAQKTKNFVLEQQLKEAQKNNVVQLKNILLSRHNNLDEAYQARTELGGYLKKLKFKLDQTDKDDTYYSQKKSMYESVEKAFENNGKVLQQAKLSLQEFEKKVRSYESMSEFSAIAGKIAAALETDNLEEMLSLEAFNSIETEYCNAMAALDTSIEMADI